MDDTIRQSHIDIYKFTVIQAEVMIDPSLLNITVLFTFTTKCMVDCQTIEINKLKNMTLIILDPIVITYDGKTHSHNLSFFGKSLHLLLS